MPTPSKKDLPKVGEARLHPEYGVVRLLPKGRLLNVGSCRFWHPTAKTTLTVWYDEWLSWPLAAALPESGTLEERR